MNQTKELIYFLHKIGYTFYDIPRLTILEMDILVEVYNKHMRRKNKENARKR